MEPAAPWTARKNKVVIGLIASLLLLSFAISLCASSSVVELSYGNEGNIGEMGLFRLCYKGEACRTMTQTYFNTDDCVGDTACYRFMKAWEAGRGTSILASLASVSLVILAVVILSKEWESSRAAFALSILTLLLFFSSAVAITVGCSAFDDSVVLAYNSTPGPLMYVTWLGIVISAVAGITLK